MAVQTILKALAGAAAAALGALITALSDGSVAPVEWATIALAAVTALGAVWAVPNAAAPQPFTTTPTVRRQG